MMPHLNHVSTVKQDVQFAQELLTVLYAILTLSTFKTQLWLKSAHFHVLLTSIQATIHQQQTLIVSNVTRLARPVQDHLPLNVSAALTQAFTSVLQQQSPDTILEYLLEQLLPRTKIQDHVDYASHYTAQLEDTASHALQIAILVARESVQAVTLIWPQPQMVNARLTVQ